MVKMNNSAAKVGEIFTEAGAAFNRLAEMIMSLHPIADQTMGTPVKTAVKRKLPEEKTAPITNNIIAAPIQNLHSGPISRQVTLNMLNAPEPEIEVEAVSNDVKLEFEPATEEVSTTN